MNDAELNKLKVVDLRAELTKRGLDSKGTKSVLIQRLKTAINREKGLPDGAEADGGEDASLDESKDAPSQDENHDQSTINEEDETMEEDDVPDKSESAKENEEQEEEQKEQEEAEIEKDVKNGDADQDEKERGEKRKRRSPSPHRRHHHDRYSRRYSPSPRRSPPREPSPDPFDDTLVGLDTYNCDLNLVIEKSHYRAEPLSEGGFAYMWAGAKAMYGVTSGKVAFEAKVLKLVEVNLPEKEEEKHGFRIGFSSSAASLQLGEDKLSYGYADNGKSCSDSEFKDYGETYGAGDVVTAFLNLDSDPIEISFAKNGEHQGVAFTVAKEDLGETALFPHVLSKNCAFDINFGQEETQFADFPEGYADYTLIGKVPLEQRVRAPKAPTKKEECEILMMCGLPACGKTTWALKQIAEHEDKKYTLLGTYGVIDKMKVNGEPRKKHLAGKWEVLVEKASLCLNKLLDMASRRYRNYILDQTNTHASAQRRKMRPFEGFKRTAIVIVPSEEEYKKRSEKQKEEGNKDISEHAVLEMKANFELPVEGHGFDSITYVELDKEEAEKLVKKFNEEGRAALASRKRSRPYSDRGRRGGYYDKRPRRGYRSRPYDRRGPPSYYGGSRGGGGGGYRDYRPYRGRRGGYGGSNYSGPSPWKQGYGWNQGGYGGGGYGGGGGGGYYSSYNSGYYR